MRHISRLAATAAALAMMSAAPVIVAQQPPAVGAPARFGTFPERPPGDAAAIARGKTLYTVNCQFCHGTDTRGGDSGPSLLRSSLVLDDRNGERIAPVVREGRPEGGMPKFPLTDAEVGDLAAFIHSFRTAGYDESRLRPPSIVVGDRQAGEAYFMRTCASCHSAAGDLGGIASRIPDAKMLQQRWLMPATTAGRGAATTARLPAIRVAVTLPSGERVSGLLVRVDDFLVSLVDEQGLTRTFRTDMPGTSADIQDPLRRHKDLLPTYSDEDVHNVTAFLVTLK
jgi:cytochrome c oxidase cbb3-type subunit 3